MPINDGTIRLPPDSTGKIIDTSEGTVESQTVERQRINIASPDFTNPEAIASVDNSDPTQSEYGLTVRPITAGGSNYHAVSAASNNAANIKGLSGILFNLVVYNNAYYPVFIKFYNKATLPLPGSDTPLRTFGVQAGTEFSWNSTTGVAFSLGIGISITKGIADNDDTFVAVSDCVVDALYK